MGERAGDWGFIHPEQTPQSPAPSSPPWIVPPSPVSSCCPLNVLDPGGTGCILGWAALGGCGRKGLQADIGGRGVKGSVHPSSASWGIKDSQGDLKVKPSLSH